MGEPESQTTLLHGLGARTLHIFDVAAGLAATLVSAVRGGFGPGLGAKTVTRSLMVKQIFYTSFQALPMISVVAIFVGATLTAQTELLGGALQRETAGKVLVAVVIRELAPLVTAIIVAGRSGTAIATELGVMRVQGEVLGLASLGIDPPRFLVWPRLIATTLGVPILTIYFSAMAVLGGYAAALFIDPNGLSEWQQGAMFALSPADLPLILVKTLGLGALVGWLCSYYGLDVGSSPTEVPQKASRAVVQTLLACIVYNATITIIFYWLVGGTHRMILDIPIGGEPGVTLDRVYFEYAGRMILDGISWELDASRNAVITGASGSGKSTFLQIAAGLLPPTRGSVLMAGHPVAKLLPSERVRRGLRTGFVFQEAALFSNLDVFSNVSLALYYHQDVFELSDEAVIARTEEALEATQISRAHWNTLPAHLSFGDRKRLALARAIAIRPNFLFFDDPDVGMDQKTARVTHQILCELRDDPRVTLVVATNRTAMIERLQIPAFRLEAGRIDENTRVSSMAPAFPEAPGLPTDIYK